MFTTTGNHDSHVILRGGIKPNYDSQSVGLAAAQLSERKIQTGLMIDFSHANCQKQFARQILVGQDVAAQISNGCTDIVGCMIESHLHEGKQAVVAGQALRYGQSITDPCLGFDDTQSLLEDLANAVVQRA